jgi:hypothetical protein
MITIFKLFEIQLMDNSFIFHDKSSKFDNKDLTSHIEKDIKKDRKTFEIDQDLITSFYSEGMLRFDWNNRPNHNIYEKIRERTHLKSISEFNDIFKKAIKQVIPSKLNRKDIDKDGCYALYLPENEFYIIIQIDPDALIDGYFINKYGKKQLYHLWVVTIHNKTTLEDYKYYKKIIIDDSYFNV